MLNQKCARCGAIKPEEAYPHRILKNGKKIVYKTCIACIADARRKVGGIKPKAKPAAVAPPRPNLTVCEILKPQYWISPPLSTLPEYQYD